MYAYNVPLCFRLDTPSTHQHIWKHTHQLEGLTDGGRYLSCNAIPVIAKGDVGTAHDEKPRQRVPPEKASIVQRGVAFVA